MKQTVSEKRLFDDDRFAGTTIARFLAGVFLFGGHGVRFDHDHGLTHLEHLGTNVHTDFTCCAERVVDTNLHFAGPLKPNGKQGLRSTSTIQPVGGCLEVHALRIHKEANLHQAPFLRVVDRLERVAAEFPNSMRVRAGIDQQRLCMLAAQAWIV